MLAKKTLTIYVDESGNFEDIRDPSRFCMVTLVFHDADVDLSACSTEYARRIFNLGADPEMMSFHTAPLIRQEYQFSAMSRNMRGKLFYQMLSFVRKSDVRYRCLCVDTAFVASQSQVLTSVQTQLNDFAASLREEFECLEGVSVYYDAGQKGVTRLLEGLSSLFPCPVAFVQGARQNDHLLLQVADFLCTICLIERRITEGIPFNRSERKFFGSPRDFKRNVLRKLKHREL